MKRLFFKLYLFFVLTLLLSLVAIGGISTWFYGDTEDQEFNNHIAAYRSLVIESADNNPTLQLSMMRRMADIIEAEIAEIQASELNIDELNSDELTILTRQGVLVIDSADGLSYFTLPQSATIYRLQYRDDSIVNQESELVVGLIFLGLLLPPFIFLIIWLSLLARRLSLLENAANAISKGDFSVRASTNAKHQIGRLNVSFNEMAQRIQQLMSSSKQLTNAVAHELRSPIFRLQCQVDMLAESDCEQEKSELLDGANDDIQELGSLVDEMLQYARMENAELTVNKESYDVVIWLVQIIDQTQLESPVHIDFSHACEELKIEFDDHLLRRAILNLLRNASRYAKNSIQVSVESRNNTTFIHIDDDGPGIPESQRENVFKPFYRLSYSRQRSDGGFGLGLAITEQIIKRHNGSISIEKSPQLGARFTIELP